jgi:hypothetical protein
VKALHQGGLANSPRHLNHIVHPSFLSNSTVETIGATFLTGCSRLNHMDPKESPFEAFSFSQKQLLYKGLLALVKSNSGRGFANGDQGHPAYAIGRGGTFDYDKWGDSPDRNEMFQMMQSLSGDLCVGEIDGSSEIGEYVHAWCDFCEIAYNAYLDAKKNRQPD